MGKPKNREHWFPLGTVVQTPDGLGKTVKMEMRKNTNGGPGCRQYRVQLDDGRIRHYQMFELELITSNSEQDKV